MYLQDLINKEGARRRALTRMREVKRVKPDRRS